MIAIAAPHGCFLALENTLNPTILYVSLIVFTATLIQSSLGFGGALVAAPLLATIIPLRQAAPLVVLFSITIAAIVMAQDWKKIHLRSTGWLLLPTLAGIPLGLLLLTSVHQSVVKAALGLVILALAVYFLAGQQPLELRSDHLGWLLACGFCAGVLGGAYGINGPPLVVYGSMRRWPAQQFRATLQAYFLPASLVGLCGYWLAGLWVHAVTRYYLFALPVVIPAVLLGRVVNHRMKGDVFLRYVYLGLGGIGALLVYQAIIGKI